MNTNNPIRLFREMEGSDLLSYTNKEVNKQEESRWETVEAFKATCFAINEIMLNDETAKDGIWSIAHANDLQDGLHKQGFSITARQSSIDTKDAPINYAIDYCTLMFGEETEENKRDWQIALAAYMACEYSNRDRRASSIDTGVETAAVNYVTDVHNKQGGDYWDNEDEKAKKGFIAGYKRASSGEAVDQDDAWDEVIHIFNITETPTLIESLKERFDLIRKTQKP